jgi:ATP-dependent RNA helicase DDX5/DBP2
MNVNKRNRDAWAEAFAEPEPVKKKKKNKIKIKVAKKGEPTAEQDAIEDAAAQFREDNQMTVSGRSANCRTAYTVPAPTQSFAATPFNDRIIKALTKAGYLAPTATQAQSWPICLQKRDIISIAKTGSGKTLGFLLPALYLIEQNGKIVKQKQQLSTVYFNGISPQIVVLAPVRELACQIHDEAKKFVHAIGVKSVCLYGGAPRKGQIEELKSKKPAIVVCTPGRLNDLLDIKTIDVSCTKIVVLDEADRMLDMGFEPQIHNIIKQMPAAVDRQTMLFSATWPESVRKLSKLFLNNPVQLMTGDSDKLNANKAITQHVQVVDAKAKGHELGALMAKIAKDAPIPDKKHHPKVLIFVSKKSTCNKLSSDMWDDGKLCDCLHGDREQWERTKVMNKFKKGELRILVATDVAARGLDVKDIDVVINFDFPVGKDGVEDYVHRIGRTGRAGKTGLAYTFFTVGDGRDAALKLIECLQGAAQKVPLELVAMYPADGSGSGIRYAIDFGDKGKSGGSGDAARASAFDRAHASKSRYGEGSSSKGWAVKPNANKGAGKQKQREAQHQKQQERWQEQQQRWQHTTGAIEPKGGKKTVFF